MTFSRIMVVYLAIEDIFAGTLIPSTVVIISFTVSSAISKMVSPFIVRNISFRTSIFWSSILLTISNITVVAIDLVELRIAGVILFGIATGWAVIAVAQMMPCFGAVEELASAFQTGNNFAALITSCLYLGN